MKIVINGEVGAFRLSEEALRLYVKRSERAPPPIIRGDYIFQGLPSDSVELRTDPLLVQLVEQLGSRANGLGSQLEVVQIPDGAQWHIVNVCGIETVLLDEQSGKPKITGRFVR